MFEEVVRKRCFYELAWGQFNRLAIKGMRMDQLKNLKILNLSSNLLTNASIKTLLKVSMPALSKLYLSNLLITSDAMRIIGKKLPVCLEYL